MTEPETRRFAGKVALVTGVASGMGRATSARLAGEGARVLGVDIDEKGMDETAAMVREAGGEMQAHVCDVSRRDACFAAVEAAVVFGGRLDVLVNVAGIVRIEHTPDMSEEDWNLVLAVNLSGPLYLSQAAIPHLLETGGNIVNIASNAALMGQAYTAAYCASKGGLVQLTRALAMEYMRRGIRVNAICPAGTDTPMNRNAQLPENIDGKLIQRYMNQRGFAQPEDIASAIAYVASDEARAVHGSIFTVDNGMMAG